jgi:hypothetical protein
LGHLQVPRVPLCHPLYHSKTCVSHTASFPYTVRNVSCVSVADLPGLKQNLMFAPCSLTTKQNTTYTRCCYGWNGKARTFISPIPKGHNMNAQKLVYAPNHTCPRVSVVKLYCLTTHIKRYSRSGSCTHPHPFVGRYICLQMGVRPSVVVNWETRREVVVAYFNRLLYSYHGKNEYSREHPHIRGLKLVWKMLICSITTFRNHQEKRLLSAKYQTQLCKNIRLYSTLITWQDLNLG